ncbi:unnamed protein product [Prorocentrum cordatum]|uniref:J domain-containing protein n=1 Tax=Prorocentrum cordatum TaxID=2364126 RepID=A0ABN9UNZ8_9DINO|nr:unnamed protein product [Polarella glacialis]
MWPPARAAARGSGMPLALGFPVGEPLVARAARGAAGLPAGVVADTEVAACLELFGLPEGADAASLRARYLELAKELHPDSAPGRRGSDASRAFDPGASSASTDAPPALTWPPSSACSAATAYCPPGAPPGRRGGGSRTGFGSCARTTRTARTRSRDAPARPACRAPPARPECRRRRWESGAPL